MGDERVASTAQFRECLLLRVVLRLECGDIDELIGVGLQIVEELERRLVGAVHEVAGIHPVGRANPFPAGDGSRDDNEFAQKVLAPIGRRLALGKRKEAATTLSSRRVIAVW